MQVRRATGRFTLISPRRFRPLWEVRHHSPGWIIGAALPGATFPQAGREPASRPKAPTSPSGPRSTGTSSAHRRQPGPAARADSRRLPALRAARDMTGPAADGDQRRKAPDAKLNHQPRSTVPDHAQAIPAARGRTARGRPGLLPPRRADRLAGQKTPPSATIRNRRRRQMRNKNRLSGSGVLWGWRLDRAEWSICTAVADVEHGLTGVSKSRSVRLTRAAWLWESDRRLRIASSATSAP
jgi:hypothetical protein